MTPKLKVFLIALTLALLLDQGTKIWVDTNMSFADRITVVDGFFYITHVRNPGAAFGLFADAEPKVRRVFFLTVSLIAIGIIVSFQRKLAPGDRLSGTALGLILGGAIGNLIDRVRFDEVVDFLHFRLWSGYVWPDFNLADSFIVVGVGLLVLELIASEGEQRAEGESADSGTAPAAQSTPSD